MKYEPEVVNRMKEIEEYLNAIPMWASKKNSLEDIREFLKQMGNPDESMKIIHVAGTNGKGSVCSFLTSMLMEAGYKVGTFISPHLVSTKERFLINGEPADDDTYEQAFGTVRELADEMAGRGYQPPTYFEFLFYMFMEIGRRCRPDFVILETGLGGRLDTTNVVRRPVLTVITSISMDHMQYLGHTIPAIASEKAGILKAGVPIVYDDNCRESSEVIRNRARELLCPEYPVSVSDYEIAGCDESGSKIRLPVDGQEPLLISIPSQADYQMMNTALAVRAVMVLQAAGAAEVSMEAAVRGMEKSYWPGRMEEVLPGIFLDGAHNAGGMEALTRTALRLQKKSGKAAALMFGVVSDKEYHKMIEELCSHLVISHVTIARMDTGRSVNSETLAGDFRKRLGCPVEAFDSVAEAWNHFLTTKGDGLAFCAGSLYLVGEVKALLKEENHD